MSGKHYFTSAKFMTWVQPKQRKLRQYTSKTVLSNQLFYFCLKVHFFSLASVARFISVIWLKLKKKILVNLLDFTCGAILQNNISYQLKLAKNHQKKQLHCNFMQGIQIKKSQLEIIQTPSAL